MGHVMHDMQHMVLFAVLPRAVSPVVVGVVSTGEKKNRLLYVLSMLEYGTRVICCVG